jgi:hypothetical protein
MDIQLASLSAIEEAFHQDDGWCTRRKMQAKQFTRFVEARWKFVAGSDPSIDLPAYATPLHHGLL